MAHFHSPGVWWLLLVLGACRAAPEPPSTTSTPRTATPAPSASQALSASAASPTSRNAEEVSDGEAQVEAADAGQPQSPPKVLARGTRVIVVDRGSVAAQRPGGQAPPLALAPTPRDKDTKLSAIVGPFLGRADLLDVTIVESSEHGWRYQSRETHYVLDTSGANDVLACVFVGATRSGGEYASNSTSIGIKQTSRKPLAFEVTRTTTSRTSQPRGRSESQTTKAVDHYELGASSCANAALPP